MGAVVRIWLKSLIDTFQWGRLHSALVTFQSIILGSHLTDKLVATNLVTVSTLFLNIAFHSFRFSKCFD